MLDSNCRASEKQVNTADSDRKGWRENNRNTDDQEETKIDQMGRYINRETSILVPIDFLGTQDFLTAEKVGRDFSHPTHQKQASTITESPGAKELPPSTNTFAFKF